MVGEGEDGTKFSSQSQREWEEYTGGSTKIRTAGVIRAYLQEGSQESGGRGGEGLRNGVGRDYLEKSIQNHVSRGFRFKNQLLYRWTPHAYLVS